MDADMGDDTCQLVLTFSGVKWGHFQVKNVITHWLTRGSDDVTPQIGDWRSHEVKSYSSVNTPPRM